MRVGFLSPLKWLIKRFLKMIFLTCWTANNLKETANLFGGSDYFVSKQASKQASNILKAYVLEYENGSFVYKI